jgi:Protein of unknown function (DUF1091)
MKNPGMEVCPFLTPNDKLLFFNAWLKSFRRMFPNLPKACPIKVGKYAVQNITIHKNHSDFDANDNRFASLAKMPNGVNKFVIALATKTDPEVLRVEWLYETKERMNEDNM